MQLQLSDPISVLPKVGPKTSQFFHKLGVFTLQDLLLHFPSSYQDLSRLTPLKNLQLNTIVTLKARLQTIASKRAHRRRMTITEGLISDGETLLPVVWFNQPYLLKSLHTEKEYLFTGKAQAGRSGPQLTSPSCELVKTEQVHAGRIVPIYSLSGRLTSRLLRFLIKTILPLARDLPDWLPPEIVKRQKLQPLAESLRQIHFPDSLAQQRQAKRRLAFDEMFLIQLTVQQKRHELATYRAPAIPFSQKLVRSFVDSLPFALTNGQRQAAWEILQDLAKKTPMNRLLEGDVGSGKTLVAAIALLEVAINGRQGVIMVPTEVLALQHFKNFAQLFKNYDLNIGLLTNAHQKMARKGVEKNNKLIRAAIGRGRASIAIGTHSLIQEKVTYRDLALVVVDEQHRFGVAQRQALHDKTPNQIPHFLSMTATPIPRTLALTLYGDLDISLITELPKHRKPVKTFYIPPQKRAGAYDFIRKEIKSDRQVFVICPLIEESDKLGVRAATLEQEKLSRTVFPDLKIGLLHGQMKPDVKQRVMKNFVDGKTDILVSTAVVEVGVDVPNATVMLIEGAERFGLSQLHQFRGRVGRSRYQSYCFLFTDSTSENTKKRLEALIKSRNGFELAEYDLRQRGPGEVLGTKQSGFPELKVASLTDLSLIKAAREEATKLVATNLSSYPQLYEKISAWQKKIHWE